MKLFYYDGLIHEESLRDGAASFGPYWVLMACNRMLSPLTNSTFDAVDAFTLTPYTTCIYCLARKAWFPL